MWPTITFVGDETLWHQISWAQSVMAIGPFVAMCLCATFDAGYAASSPSLNTRNLGQLVGVEEFSEDGIPYHSFKGVRYAEPPVGPLRFKVRT